MTTSYQVHGSVAVITLADPPVNSLGHLTRLSIIDSLQKACDDAAVKAVVITGAGKAFSGGADIKEFGPPKALAEPNLHSVIRAVENSSKPVVAAIYSVCMGGGASPEQVDKAIEKFGFAMGPFRMIDMAGNDISWAIRKRHNVEHPELRYSRSADLLCEMSRFGQKTGAGWYDYALGKREAMPSPLVRDVLENHRRDIGVKPRRISDEEIVQRLVYALVNEGARILEEGIASKASDIDMVYIMGYGFPVQRGGPMLYADEQGLFNLVRAMKRFAKNPMDDVNFWQPAPLLAKLAAENKTFN